MVLNEGMASSAPLNIAKRMPPLPEDPAFIRSVRDLLQEAAADFPLKNLEGLLLSAGAKLLRPRLVQISGEIAGVNQERALADLAACAELLHAASLIHDDVIDESHERRGAPTLHRISGTHAAVLAGDHLLARSLKLASQHGNLLVEAAARAMERMSCEAVRELQWRSNHFATVPSMDLPSLLSLAAGKTGALFGFCLETGPLLLAKNAQAQAWHRAGVHLGVAFQLSDDLIDFKGGAGKPIGADLREGNSNALVTAATQLGWITQAFESEVAQGHWIEACRILLSTPALELVHTWIRAELDAARRELGEFAQEAGFTTLFDALEPKAPTQGVYL